MVPFCRELKIDYIHLLYIKLSIVDVISQFLKKQANKVITWPTALPHPTAYAVVCLEIKNVYVFMMDRRI